MKGKGIDFIEGDYRWHYGSFDAQMAAKARESLERFYQSRAGGPEPAKGA